MKCKECEYCKTIGRTNEQGVRGSRKTYYCENPEVYNLKNKKGFPIYNFIGYGDTTIESPLQLKTSKKWCPLKKEE